MFHVDYTAIVYGVLFITSLIGMFLLAFDGDSDHSSNSYHHREKF